MTDDLHHQVEAQVDAVCRSLERRLGDVSVPVAQLPEAMLNLSKLYKLKARAGDAKSSQRSLAADGSGDLLGSVHECIRLQGEAVFASMTRTIVNFNDGVSHMALDDAPHPQQQQPAAGDDHLLAGGKRDRDGMGAEGRAMGQGWWVRSGGGQGQGQVAYDSMVVSLVSTLTKQLSTSLIRLLSLKAHAVGMMQLQRDKALLADSRLGSSSNMKRDREAASALEALLLRVSRNLVRYVHASLRPLLHQQHPPPDHHTRSSPTSSSPQQPAGRAGWGASQAATLECLHMICLARSQVRNARGVASEVLSEMDSVIEALSTCAMKEVFAAMQTSLALVAQHAHVASDATTTTSSVELGTSPLPAAFQEALLLGISQVTHTHTHTRTHAHTDVSRLAAAAAPCLSLYPLLAPCLLVPLSPARLPPLAWERKGGRKSVREGMCAGACTGAMYSGGVSASAAVGHVAVRRCCQRLPRPPPSRRSQPQRR